MILEKAGENTETHFNLGYLICCWCEASLNNKSHISAHLENCYSENPNH